MADSLWPELLEDVLDHTVEPVAPSGQRRCDGRTQTEAWSERVGGRRRRKYMNANRSHTRLHTHWRCPSVFPLDMFRGASRGENTYKRWTQPGQLRKCWPNLFIFFAWCSTCYLITYAQLYIFTVSLWHQHFNHGHTWQWLHQSFCQGTWTCDDILGGFILEGKLCKKKKCPCDGSSWIGRLAGGLTSNILIILGHHWI